MPWFARFMNDRRLMDEKKDGDGGGGGGNPAPNPDPTKEISDLKQQIEELKKLVKPQDPKPDDQDLNKKAQDLKDQKEKEAGGVKATEDAIKFNLKASEFVKTNESLLPKDFKDLLEAAEKETYGSEVEKANSIKAGMIKSFFSVQSNVDVLTPSQKTVLDEYLKMTNNARQEKASEIYAMIFEPTFESIKRVKRADALKNGFDHSDAKTAYENKLIALGRKHYLGEKTNA